jgi:antitoxin component of MazEF toxin-antitoxin module
MVKIQKLPNGQLVLTIPKRLAEYEGLDKGVEVEFKKHAKGFVLEITKRKKREVNLSRAQKTSKNKFSEVEQK